MPLLGSSADPGARSALPMWLLRLQQAPFLLAVCTVEASLSGSSRAAATLRIEVVIDPLGPLCTFCELSKAFISWHRRQGLQIAAQ